MAISAPIRYRTLIVSCPRVRGGPWIVMGWVISDPTTVSGLGFRVYTSELTYKVPENTS